MTLTKAHLIDSIRYNNGISKKQSTELVETIIETLKRKLESGENVLIGGFGKFCVRNKTERRGRNPAIGEDKILPARRVVTFRCSGKLREKINGG